MPTETGYQPRELRPPQKGKNIVLCLDGTGNEYGDRNSNVVKLYKALVKDAGRQVVYYHPGVGTMGAKNALSAAGKAWTKFRGLAFGYGLSENMADAYEYLMHTYAPDDKIFIFGFSRGAYTARALCGLLQMFGLLSPGNEGLVPYAIRLFKSENRGVFFKIRQTFGRAPNKFRIAAGFRKTFCRPCKPHFLGVWDTVSSVGWILDPIGLKPGRLPYTFALDEVALIRHAVSVDERRAFFRQNLVQEDANGQKRDLKQVWFPGVHSDVGGSYPEAESGLAKISLRWMLLEAVGSGLLVDDAVAEAILGGDLAYAKPRSNALMHNSLTFRWWLGEFWPKWTQRRVSDAGEEPARFKGRPRLNLFRRRSIGNTAWIHQSVLDRIAADPSYNPSNLPKSPNVEPDPDRDPYPVHLEPGKQIEVGVHALLKWNDTGIQVFNGEKYRIEAAGRWYDATISVGPEGYPSPNFYFRMLERFRRVRTGNWFALTGTIGRNEARAFLIGPACELDVTVDGVLHCFANDLPFAYGNNSGCLKVTVTRV